MARHKWVKSTGGRVWDFPPCGPTVSFPQKAEQEHDSRHIMFIVREPCLKTERTRKTDSAREKKHCPSFFFLLDKIGLEESIRLLCVCVCVRKGEKKKNAQRGLRVRNIMCV